MIGEEHSSIFDLCQDGRRRGGRAPADRSAARRFGWAACAASLGSSSLSRSPPRSRPPARASARSGCSSRKALRRRSSRAGLKGDSDVDYLVRAGAGQTITVSLTPFEPVELLQRPAAGQQGCGDVRRLHLGQDFTGVLPADGDYAVRVYLMRSAARRNEAGDYTLTVAVTGAALAPTPRVAGRAPAGHVLPRLDDDRLRPVHRAVPREEDTAVRGVRHPPRLRRHRHRGDPAGELRPAPHPLRERQARRRGFIRPADLHAAGRRHHREAGRGRAVRGPRRADLRGLNQPEPNVASVPVIAGR